MTLRDVLPDEAKPHQWFGDKGRLKTDQLAEYVLDHLELVTFEDTGEIYIYKDGIYVRRGEPAIRQFLTKELRDRYSKHIRSEVVEVVQNKTANPREEFGRSDEWVCLADEQVNLRTGERRPHNPADEYLSKINIPLDPEATCPAFDEFLEEQTAEPEMVWAMFAHALHRGYPSQSAFMLWGDTATGKSTTLRVLEHILGPENVSATSIKQMRKDSHAMADLYGKQANIVAEAPSPMEMKSQDFKALTGGDPVRANKKYHDPFSFRNTATLIFAINLSDMPEPAKLSKLPEEYRRRWNFITYKNKVPAEERIHNYEKEFIENEDELQGIVRKALEQANKVFYSEEWRTENRVADQGI